MTAPRLTGGELVVRPCAPRDAAAHAAAIDHDEIARWIDFPRPLREADFAR